MRKVCDNANLHYIFVGRTGIEPVTSCLSSKRSKPTELTSLLCLFSASRQTEPTEQKY